MRYVEVEDYLSPNSRSANGLHNIHVYMVTHQNPFVLVPCCLIDRMAKKNGVEIWWVLIRTPVRECTSNTP